MGATEPAIDDFAELFRVHYPRVVRALKLAGGSPDDAQDIAQEAFARTLRHWRRIRGGSSAAGYVFRTAFRLLRKRGLLPPTAGDLGPGDVPAAPGPEEPVIFRTDFDRTIALLPPRRRACVLLVWCLDQTPAEAGEALGIAAATVRKQLDLARGALRAQVGP